MTPGETEAAVTPACDDVARADLTALARALVDAALEARQRVLEARVGHGPQRGGGHPVRRATNA